MRFRIFKPLSQKIGWKLVAKSSSDQIISYSMKASVEAISW